MLNGFECHEQVNVTAKMVEQAVSRLRRFLFVGVTDRYAEGVEAFHIVMQHGTRPSKFELENHRGGAYPQEDKQACLQWMLDTGFEDPYDDVIYRVAQELFNGTLLAIKHGKYNKDPMTVIPASSVPRPKIRPRARRPPPRVSKRPLNKNKLKAT